MPGYGKPFYCLAVACSPRKGGNTELLARSALEGAAEAGAEVEIIHLGDFHYAPCIACNGCYKKGRCVVDDGAVPIFEKILKAGGIILAAPIFSMGMCAQAKMLIDRCQQFWACKYVLNRPVIEDEKKRLKRRGVFISTAGTDLPGVFDGAVRVAKYFFKMVEARWEGSYCYPKVDSKGEILDHPMALEEIKEAGRNLVIF
ncbi:MAG: flavodoxin family protein [Firmicutes bacterium]|nr:flavodoxin family protein [Bacillota bacterium]